MPYVRVVRFTDVDPQRIADLNQRVQESGGPPEGVSASGITVVHDEGAKTAVVLQHFDSKEDMESSAKVLDAMDSSETPGTRASVDSGEVKVEMRR